MTTRFAVFLLLTFQIIVRQITYLILELLHLSLVLAVVHVLARDDVVRVLYQILVAVWVGGILR